MIGIYDDSFIDYLRDNLKCEPKIRTANIVVRCPWCELREKKEYNLWISSTAPIYKCFSGGCGQKGLLKKLFTRISGKDKISDFVDETTQRNILKQTTIEKRNKIDVESNLIIPDLNEDFYKEKSMYVKRRIKYYNTPLSNINGLVFSIKKFVEINNIKLSDKIQNILPFLDSNFVGFLTNKKSILMLRNIDATSSFKHYKLEIQKTRYIDYYKINNFPEDSDDIVVGEGIYDILSEHIFDTLNIKNKIRLYAAAFSTSYNELLKSISFNEQIFRMNVHVISDRDVKLDFYKKIKMYNNHLIKSMCVYYNKTGKDFNNNPCIPVKYII